MKLDSDDLLALQHAIMCDPGGPPVIQGTGGLRKIRFAPSKWNTGKRGALRVCYVYFELHKTIVLAIVYPKAEREDLSNSEKRDIRTVIQRIEKEFERRSGK